MYIFCGDSNVRQFYTHTYGYYSITSFSGATIKGLANETSEINHGKIINYLSKTPNIKHLILLFGAVDVDFTYMYKINKNEYVEFEKYASSLAEIYVKYIKSITNDSLTIHILGIQLSPLDDNNYAKVLKPVCGIDIETTYKIIDDLKLDHMQRNKNTILLNDMLENEFKNVDNVIFHRIDKEMLNGGQIIDEIHINGSDHHPKNTLKLWKSKLSKYIKILE